MTGVAFTGFRHFPGVPDNPSQRLIEALRNERLPALAQASFHLLDTAYETAPQDVAAILSRRPTALVMTGYSAIANGLKIETAATNMRSRRFADASGFRPADAEHAPVRIDAAKIDFTALEKALRRNAIAHHLSNDAGEYVCNHAYFCALSHPIPPGAGIPTVFVHLPAIAGSELARSSASEMALPEMVRAMAVLAETISQPGGSRG